MYTALGSWNTFDLGVFRLTVKVMLAFKMRLRQLPSGGLNVDVTAAFFLWCLLPQTWQFKSAPDAW